eukprot:gnl/Trimastix_PCT/1586.p3 GENE.gnl/Trimastix_PCT/1586~~gnl/Trimastix_PCT/1586.p3  ORF type:complete len:117 (-),score=11.10 gnl/Trimastix_PCT/1586:222-572(-)
MRLQPLGELGVDAEAGPVGAEEELPVGADHQDLMRVAAKGLSKRCIRVVEVDRRQGIGHVGLALAPGGERMRVGNALLEGRGFGACGVDACNDFVNGVIGRVRLLNVHACKDKRVP